MSRPKIHSKKYTAAMLPGEYRFVALMECGLCGSDIQVEADNDLEAQAAFVDEGVRSVDADHGMGYMMCPDCVDLARQNKLEE
mgnify:CR=1 FL=1